MIPYIILAIEDDDDRAFAEHMYVTYRKLMLSEIQKLLSNSWDADDVLQTVVEKLIDKLALLRTLSRTHLINYIITACRNTAISLLREQGRHQSYSFDDVFDIDIIHSASWQSSVEDQVLLQIDEETAYKVWKQLSPNVQSLLAAKYILEQSDEEIASTLGIKPGSVRMALTRARREFRERLYVY